MKALLMPVGSAGDMHPYLGIGAALKARGHDVTIVANPYFAPRVEKAGLILEPWGTVQDYDTLTRHPDLWHTRKATQVISAALKRGIPDLYRIVRTQAERGPLVLVAHGLAFAARTAHEALGLPLVTIHLQPSSVLSVHDAPVLHPWLTSINRLPVSVKRLIFLAIDREADRVFGPAVNGLRTELGLAPARQIVMPMAFDQPDNASRLGRLGVARTVWPRDFRGPAVAATLDATLEVGYRERTMRRAR